MSIKWVLLNIWADESSFLHFFKGSVENDLLKQKLFLFVLHERNLVHLSFDGFVVSCQNRIFFRLTCCILLLVWRLAPRRRQVIFRGFQLLHSEIVYRSYKCRHELLSRKVGFLRDLIHAACFHLLNRFDCAELAHDFPASFVVYVVCLISHLSK